MKGLLIILGLALGLNAFGQKEAENWFFGQYSGLDFSCSPPQAVRSGMYYVTEGSSSISDSDGNLQFYTNGDSVYTKEHQMMVNGFDIGQRPDCWGSSTQGALIVPQPNSDDIYFIFVADCADIGTTTGLTYSVVDMSLNNGLGEVVLKAQPLHSPSTEKLAAVQHANGQDFWVLSHEHGTDAFMAYLVTEAGLNTDPVISNVGHVQWLPTFPESMKRGYMKFSPNGEKVFVVTASDQHSFALTPQMFSFESNIGTLSLDYTVEDPDSVRYYGASFSPDNSLLYLSGGWYDAVIHQFDATSTNSTDFLMSRQVIYPQGGPATYSPCALQIGPDGKIYVAAPSLWWLDVIHSPNTYGQDCEFEHQALFLEDCPQTFGKIGLPNLPESYYQSSYLGAQCQDTLIADFIYSNACIGEQTNFQDSSFIYPEEVGSWNWDFGDPSSGLNNTSDEQNPSHVYSDSGEYTVTLSVADDPISPCKTSIIAKDIEVDICSSITELDGGFFQLSPNPFADIFGLTLKDKATVEIYSTNGQLVLDMGEFEAGENQINLGSTISNGIWLIRISTSDSSVFEKIIKLN